MHDGISSRGDFVPTLPHKCLLPSVRKTSLSPGPQGLGLGLFLPSILYAAPTGGSSGQLRCQREPWYNQGAAFRPLSGPPQRPRSPAPLSGPCHLLPGHSWADESWMSCAPRIPILSGRMPPFSPSSITLHCPPPTPAWQPCPPPWVLPPVLLPLKWPPSGQASPL